MFPEHSVCVFQESFQYHKIHLQSYSTINSCWFDSVSCNDNWIWTYRKVLSSSTGSLMQLVGTYHIVNWLLYQDTCNNVFLKLEYDCKCYLFILMLTYFPIRLLNYCNPSTCGRCLLMWCLLLYLPFTKGTILGILVSGIHAL